VLFSAFQAIGVALANVEDASIKFTGFTLENIFDSVDGLTNKILYFYKN